jgi:trehalose synthase
MREVTLPATAPATSGDWLGGGRGTRLALAAARLRRALAGRTIWQVSSTSDGGGVAELLHAVLPLARASGMTVRWVVIDGDPEMFTITKRLCAQLYGDGGDGGPLGAPQRRHFTRINQENAAQWAGEVSPGDVVVIHDPQPAALVPVVHARGARVVWRCHIGSDVVTAHVQHAWDFLRGFLDRADCLVFSTEKHVPGWVEPRRVRIIPPAIDPTSPRNVELAVARVRDLLADAGLISTDRPDAGTAQDHVQVVREGPAPGPDRPMVVQVSRWDKLKDMAGVLRAFARTVDLHPEAYLTLAGPDVTSIVDDPPAAEVFADCVRAWQAAPARLRRRSQLASLPMTDRTSNALLVNALQRHASVVVQKSLAEGFGLTATEAMWKARPLVVSDVGGLGEQVVNGEHGLVLPDPTVLPAAGEAVARLLSDPALAEQLGRRARLRVADYYLLDRLLRDWADTLLALVEED